MIFNHWKVESPEGILLIENGYPTEIRLGGDLKSSKRKLFPPEIHEFEADGANYKVTLKMGINPFNNMGVKCFVERNGQLIADNPKQAGYNRRLFIIATVVGFIIGFGGSILLFGPLGAG